MKKKILTVSILLILLAIIGGGTFAAYTYDTWAHNVITSGKVDIELKETLADGVTPFPNGKDEKIEGIVPGRTQAKHVWVDNLGEEAWIRIKVTTRILDEKGRELPLTAEITDGNGEKQTVDLVYLDVDAVNTENLWRRSGDYYYYCKSVPAGGKTAKLFENVSFSAEGMDNAYQNCTVTIHVEAEGIQAANNPLPAGESITYVWPESTKNPIFDFLK